MSDVKATVVIAARNAGRTIDAAIGSALAQTVADIEVIVVDDGSQDDTGAIVKAWVRKDPRVILLSHHTNRGVSAARNTAIARARGDWIAVLDADDQFAERRLETLIKAAEARQLDAIIDNLSRVDALTGRDLGHAFPDAWMTSADPMPLSFVLEHDYAGRHDVGFGYCKPVFRTEFFRSRVGGYVEDIHCGEDVLALQTMLYEGARVGLHPEALYLYTYSMNSLSRRKGGYPDVSRVNRRLGTTDERHGGPLATLIAQRQTAIDYDGFVTSVRQRHWQDMVYFFTHVPKKRLFDGLSRAVLKRLGIVRKSR